jgi:hypothetical protein
MNTRKTTYGRTAEVPPPSQDGHKLYAWPCHTPCIVCRTYRDRCAFTNQELRKHVISRIRSTTSQFLCPDILSSPLLTKNSSWSDAFRPSWPSPRRESWKKICRATCNKRYLLQSFVCISYSLQRSSNSASIFLCNSTNSISSIIRFSSFQA